MEARLARLKLDAVDFWESSEAQELPADGICKTVVDVIDRRFAGPAARVRRDRHTFVAGISILYGTQPAKALDLLGRGMEALVVRGLDPFMEAAHWVARISGSRPHSRENVLEFIDMRLLAAQKAIVEHGGVCLEAVAGLVSRCPAARSFGVLYLRKHGAGKMVASALAHNSATILKWWNERQWENLKNAAANSELAPDVIRLIVKQREPVDELIAIYCQLQASDKFLWAASNSLVNLASRIKPDPRAVTMWSLAVELEARATQPSPHIIDKVRRLVLATEIFPDASFTSLKTAYEILVRAEIDCKASPELAGAIARVANLKPLAANALDIDGAAELLLSWISMTPLPPSHMSADRKFHIDQLMASLPLRSVSTHMEYFRATGECWSVTELSDLQDKSDDARYVLALAEVDPLAKKRWFTEAKCPSGDFIDYMCLQGLVGTPDPDISRIALQSDTSKALVELKKIAEKRTNAKKDIASAMDAMAWLGVLLRGIGNANDSRACLKGAEDAARQVDSQVRVSCYSTMQGKQGDSIGRSLASMYKLDEDVKILAVQKSHQEATANLVNDPLYSVLPETALALPAISTASLAPVPDLISVLADVTNKLRAEKTPKRWCDRMKRAKNIAAASYIVENTMPISSLANEIAAPEDHKASFVRESRAFYAHPCIECDHNAEFPDTLVVITLDVDPHGSLVVRRLGGLAVTLPPGRFQALRDPPPSFTIGQGLTELREIVSGKASSEPKSAKMSQNDARKWWAEQRARDAQLADLLSRIENSWLGGFCGLLDSRDWLETKTRSALKVLHERLSAVLGVFFGGQRRFYDAHLTIEFTALFATLAVMPYHEPRAVEDLVFAIMDGFRFKGARIEYDEIDVDALVIELQMHMVTFASDVASSMPRHKHVVVVPGAGCYEVPWESIPILRNVTSSRALSLDLLRESLSLSSQDVQHAPKSNVFYVLDPGDNLPSTREFAPEFERRGWTGIVGKPPTEKEITSALENCACYVFMGHGAGKAYVRGRTIRGLRCRCPVLLLGCGSAGLAAEDSETDACGAVTDYAIAGCPVVAGNLWNVRDKDFNRLSSELLREIFDENVALCDAVVAARRKCVLPYLTGAAMVVIGAPNYPL